MIPPHPVRPQPIPAPRAVRWLAALLGLVAAGLHAQQPTGGTVVAGSATIATAANSTVVTAGDNSVLRWNSFDIGSGETVQFVQPGASSRVLNWIGGATPSQINGSLLANGQVYLMNPSGVYFGQTAVINVGALYAVGGTMTKDDFLSGMNRFSGLTGDVTNAGSIRGGMVALVGRSVANSGSIVSPGGFIGLASGEQVLLGQNGSSIYVDAGRSGAAGPVAEGSGVANTGTIDSGAGSTVLAAGDLYSIAITQDGRLAGRDVRLQGQGRGDVLVSGTIDASGETGGRVEITGERVGLTGSANLDASGASGGGTILIGGDYQGGNPGIRNAARTFVGRDVTLSADATARGDGGKIIVWADDVTRFAGGISARGGALGGDGGFAEVSGKGWLDYQGFANLTAAAGATGTLLLDPTDITITGAGVDAAPTFGGFAGGIFDGGANNTSTISIGTGALDTNNTLLKQLSGANVVVTTTSAGAGTGNITVSDTISYNSANSLTLTAGNNLTINSGITNAGAGGLTFSSGAATAINAAVGTAGDVSLTSGTTLALGANVSGATVTINNTGALTRSAGTVTATTLNLNGSGMVATVGTPLVTDLGALVLNKAGGDTFISDIGGLSLQGTTAGSLTLTANGAITDSGALTISGTTTLAAGAANNITLDNANDFTGAVSITSGNNVAVTDTTALVVGTSTVSGTLGLTAGGHITQTGAITATAGATTVAVTAPGSDILLGTQANDFGTAAPVFGGTLTNIRDVSLRNINAGATLPSFAGLTNLRSLTLTHNSAAIALPTLSLATGGSLSVTAGGAITQAGPLTVPGALSFTTSTGDITLSEDITAGSVTLHSGTGGTGNVSFGAGVAVNADTQSYRAGDGAAGTTTATVDLTTNTPAFRNTAGAAAPSSFTFRQDAAVADATIPAVAQFGGTAPGTYVIQSDDGGITLSTGANVAGSTLTLTAGGSVAIGGSLNLTALTATGTTIGFGANSITTSQAASFNNSGALTGSGLLTAGTQLNLNGSGDTGPLTTATPVLNLATTGGADVTVTNTLDGGLTVSGTAAGNNAAVSVTSRNTANAADAALTVGGGNLVANGSGSSVALASGALTLTGGITSPTVTLTNSGTQGGTGAVTAGSQLTLNGSGDIGGLNTITPALSLATTGGADVTVTNTLDGGLTVSGTAAGNNAAVSVTSRNTANIADAALTVGGGNLVANGSGSSVALASGALTLTGGITSPVVTLVNSGTQTGAGLVTAGTQVNLNGSGDIGGLTTSTPSLGLTTTGGADITVTNTLDGGLTASGTAGGNNAVVSITSRNTANTTDAALTIAGGNLVANGTGSSMTLVSGALTLTGGISSPTLTVTNSGAVTGAGTLVAGSLLTFNGSGDVGSSGTHVNTAAAAVDLSTTGGADVFLTNRLDGGLVLTGNATASNTAVSVTSRNTANNADDAVTIGGGNLVNSGTGSSVALAGSTLVLTGGITSPTIILNFSGDLTGSGELAAAVALQLEGAGNVGTSGSLINIDTPSLTLNKSGGGVFVNNGANALALDITAFNGNGIFTAGAFTLNDAINVGANDLTFNTTTLDFGANAVTGGTVTLNQSGALTATGLITASTQLNLNGSTNVTLTTSTPSISFGTTGGVDVDVTNRLDGGVTLSGGSAAGLANLSVSSRDTLDAGGDALVIGAANLETGTSITLTGTSLTLDGDLTSPTITLNLAGDLTGTKTLAASVELTLNGTGNVGATGSGAILIDTPSLVLNKSSGAVFVDNGSNALTLNVTAFSGEGEFTAGDFTLADDINVGANNLTFNTALFDLGANVETTGTVTINNSDALTGTGTVTADTLALAGDGDVGVDDTDRIQTDVGTISFNKGAGDSFLNDAGPVTVSGSTAATVDLTAGGTVSLASGLTTGGFTTDAAISLSGGTITGPMTFTSDVTVTAATVFDGAVTLGVGAGTLNFDATGFAVEFNSALTLTSDVTFTGTTGTLTFNSGIDGAFALVINAGSGGVELLGGVGGSTPLTSLTVTGTASVSGTFATDGNTQDWGNLVLVGNATFTDATGDINFNGTIDATTAGVETLTANAAGTVKFDGDVGVGTALGAVAVTGAAIELNAADFRTEDGQVDFTGPVTLGATVTIDTVGGGTGAAINFNGATTTVDATTAGVEGLTLTSGTGAATLGGNVGSGAALGALTVTNSSATGLVIPNLTATTLTVTTGGAITDGTTTTISVSGLANLAAGTGAITLGDNGGDTANFGTLTFSTSGAVAITEDTAMALVGVNTGGTTSLTSTAGISDAGATSVDVGALTLSGTTIALGGGTFNATTVNFNSAGAVTIAEDSAMAIVGVNTAGSAALSSTAALSDAGATSVTVTGLGSFSGTSVSLGGGTFDTGTLTFNSTGAVTIAEDSAMAIVGVNTGAATSLSSTAGISDTGATSVDVGALTVSGTTIALGGGTFNATTVNFNSAGAVTIAEDSAMAIVGVNTADSAALSSTAALSDAGATSVTVTGLGSFSGTSVSLGGGTFDTGTLTFNSAGAVTIAEDSAMAIVGVNTAGSAALNSTAALSDAGATSVTVTGLADVAGTSISLGGGTFDAGTLTFNSAGAVTIAEDSAMAIVGVNTGAATSLSSTAGISDAGATSVDVGALTVSGTSIALGGGTFNATTVNFNSAGAVTIAEDSAMAIVGVNTAGSAALSSTAALSDAGATSVTVTGLADVAGTSISLGGGTFDAGTLTFNSAGAVTIAEDSAMAIVGVNTGAATALSSTAVISDAGATSVDVGALTLSGTSIALGGGTFNATTVNFNSAGAVTIAEDSAMAIVGVNTAGSAALSSTAALSDAGATSVTVTGLANVAGTSISLGGGTFDAGTLTFNSAGAVTIAEDSAMAIVGVNTGAATSLSSTAGISDTGATSVDVGALTVSGTSIALGGGTFNATTVNFNSAGAVTIDEDSAMAIVGVNTGAATALSSTAGISDAGATSVDVGALTLSGTSISLGGGTFDAGTLTFNSAGAVTIAEDSAMAIVGVNTAGSAALSSTAALSDAGATSVTVTGLADVAGTSISLGGGTFDAGTLTFNSAGAVTIAEDSAMAIVGVNTGAATSLSSTAGISDAGATSVDVGALTLSGTSIALGGGTFNATTVNFNSAGAVTIDEDSAMAIVGVNTAGSAALSSTAALSDAGASSVTVTGLGSFSGTSVSLGGGTFDAGTLTFNSAGAVTIDEDSAMTIVGVNTGAATSLSSTAGISDAGATSVDVGALTLSGTSIALGGGTFNATTINFNSGGAVAIAEDSATALTGTNTAASLALTSTGDITDVAATSMAISGLATFNAGANNITLGDDGGDTINFGTLNLTGGVVAVTEDSGTDLTGVSATNLTLTSAGDITDAAATTIAVSGLATFSAGTNNITLGDSGGDTTNFGSLNLTGGAITITEDSASVLTGTNTAASLTLTAAGTITDAAATTFAVSGLATFNAGANAITLGDNGGDTTNFGSMNLTGTAVTVTEDSATELAGLSATTLTLTSGGSITQSGVLNVSGLTTLAVTAPLSDILLHTQANNLGSIAPVLAGTVSNIRDLGFRNLNVGAKVPVIAPATTNLTGLTNLRNLTLDFPNAPIDLPGITASGNMTINAGGAITDSGASVVPGTTSLNANGNNITLDFPGNNFGTVNLAGANITLTNVSLVNLAGVQATGAFTLTVPGTMTVSSPITGSTINLSSSGGNVLLNSTVTASGDLTLAANAGSITANSSGNISAGGSLSVTAGGGIQLAGVTSPNVTITAAGGATFISPLTVNGGFLVTAPGGVTFDQSVGGGGTLTVNTSGVTRFGGPINGLSSLITNAGGTTVIAGGVLSANTFLFGDAVVLENNLVVTAGTGRFNLSLLGGSDGGQSLTLNVTGDTVLVGAVGAAGQRLASISTDAGGRTLFYGGSVLTTGAQVYNDSVLLGTNTTMGASALTFNGPLNTGPALTSLSGVNAATTGESDLIANVSGATIFNAPVGQLTRLGDVTTDAGGTTIIRANFNSTRLTVNDPMTFDTAAAITVDTTGSQFYNSTVTLGTNLTFNSTLSAVFNPAASPAEGISFAEGLSAGGRTVTITAPGATITAGGDLGTPDSRLTSLSADGRYLVVRGDIWAQGDIALAVGTGTTGENDFLQFTAPGGAARNTRLDSVDGEIILGSGATGGAEKTAAPVRSSIFKSNEGDLYLFARKVTVQPFERLVVRNGSLIAIADGTAATDGITLGSTAATNYLVLVSNTAREVPGILLRSRGPAGIDSSLGAQDQGTDLIAGAVFFFNTNFSLPGTVPTREVFAPVPATAGTFNYQLLTGNILSAFGPLAIRILPDAGGVTHNVYVADMVLSNRFRPVVGNLIYLDLNTGPGFSPGRFINGLGPFVDPASDLLGLSDVQPLRPLVSLNTAPRTVLQSAFTPNVPREDRETAPPEVDLSPAVREQLQALGIYARALRPSETRSRELRMGLFTTIPERERPRESDYEVADARVENRAVREVLRLATEAGLIGEGQAKLDEVARALAASYEAFSVLSLSQEAKDFRTWLEASSEPDSVRVLTYVKILHETLKGIELLGLTRQELASSKAQIYGSILRARLNAEPEFLRSLVEDTGTPTQVSAVGSPPVAPGSLAQATLR